MEKKLFAIECENVALVVRPNGDTVIVIEATELVLGNAVMEQIVRNSGAYKSFVTTKNEILSALEYENTNLQNEIVGLKEELEKVKGADGDDDIHRLKRERIKLRNNIMRLEKELEEAKADKDSLQQKLVNATIRAQPIAKGYTVNIVIFLKELWVIFSILMVILLQIVGQINVLKEYNICYKRAK